MGNSEFFSHDRADSQLKYIIGVLQGKHVVCSRKGRVQLALVTKELLKEHHFEWHCKIIDYHIHRTAKLEQPKRADSQQSRREDSLKLKPKISFEKWLEGFK